MLIGIKESSGNIAQITELLTTAPRSFKVFAGDDGLALPISGAWRCRVGFGGVERNSGADGADGAGRTGERLGGRAQDQPAVLPADAGTLLGGRVRLR